MDTMLQDSAKDEHLMFFARKGRAALLRNLLDCGANVNAKDKEGSTPLHFAAREGQKDAVAMLIAWGADVSAQDTIGRTPLHCAATYGDNGGVVQLLLDAGADPNAKMHSGLTALQIAASSGHQAIAKLMSQDGAGKGPATMVSPKLPTGPTRKR